MVAMGRFLGVNVLVLVFAATLAWFFYFTRQRSPWNFAIAILAAVVSGQFVVGMTLFALLRPRRTRRWMVIVVLAFAVAIIVTFVNASDDIKRSSLAFMLEHLDGFLLAYLPTFGITFAATFGFFFSVQVCWWPVERLTSIYLAYGPHQSASTSAVPPTPIAGLLLWTTAVALLLALLTGSLEVAQVLMWPFGVLAATIPIAVPALMAGFKPGRGPNIVLLLGFAVSVGAETLIASRLLLPPSTSAAISLVFSFVLAMVVLGNFAFLRRCGMQLRRSTGSLSR